MRLTTVVCSAVLVTLGAAGCSHPTSGATQNHGPLPDMAMATTMQPDQDAGTLPPSGPLTIDPLDAKVQVVFGQPLPTLQYTARVGGVVNSASWFIDRGEIGAIDANGLFATTGTVAGKATVTAIVGAQTVTTTVTVQVTRADQGDPNWSATPPAPGPGGYGGVGGDGPGAPPTPTQNGTLDGPSTNDPAVTLLYPYDGTVWPRGLRAPLVQWNPGTHKFDAVLVDIKETNYEYKGYFASNSKTTFNNVPIPQAAWDAVTYSNNGEPVTVSLTFAEGTKAYGGYTESWTIARATLKGTIYYNSYNTNLVTNSDGLQHGKQYGAGTLGIHPGSSDPFLVAGIDSKNAAGDGTGCRVCHSVTADGKKLLTQASNKTASSYADTRVIDLLNDTTKGSGTSLGASLIYPALYKDGSLALSGSPGMDNIGMDSSSRLYTVADGKLVTGVVGLPATLQAMLPVFSPDGAHVAFNFWGGTLPPSLVGDKNSLAMLDFDGTKTFSNGVSLYTPANGASVTYSSFLPTSNGVVFELELTRPSNNWGYTWKGNTGQLWWVDTATKKAQPLALLNGVKNGVPYLPAGPNGHTAAADATYNYEPTVNPIASGGYAWVVFTSRRMYGNVANAPAVDSDPRAYDPTVETTTKKLWVAAVDLNGKPDTDPSHPAFYLPSQELQAGNARGFWTVDKCIDDGKPGCVTGDECCGGYCEPGAGGTLTCTSTPPKCSAEFEKCTQDSDCCGAATGIKCINDICTAGQPPIT